MNPSGQDGTISRTQPQTKLSKINPGLQSTCLEQSQSQMSKLNTNPGLHSFFVLHLH